MQTSEIRRLAFQNPGAVLPKSGRNAPQSGTPTSNFREPRGKACASPRTPKRPLCSSGFVEARVQDALADTPVVRSISWSNGTTAASREWKSRPRPPSRAETSTACGRSLRPSRTASPLAPSSTMAPTSSPSGKARRRPPFLSRQLRASIAGEAEAGGVGADVGLEPVAET